MGNFGGPVFLFVRAPGESEKWRGEKRFFFFEGFVFSVLDFNQFNDKDIGWL